MPSINIKTKAAKVASAFRNPSKASISFFKQLRWFIYKKYLPNQLISTNLGGDGLRIRFSTSDALAYSIYWRGFFEPRIYKFVDSVLRPGMVVLDIGANIGQYTLLAALRVGSSGKVFCFEPAAREHNLLQQNVSINNLDNAFPQKYAVSNFDGKGILNTFPNGKGAYNTLGKPTHRVVNSLTSKPEQIDCVRLDTFVERKRINQVDLVKIDVEGGELDVLMGAAKLFSPMDAPLVVCEFGDETLAGFDHLGKELFDCFKRYGYIITEIVDSSPNCLRVVPKQEQYGANYIAVKVSTLYKWNLSLIES